MGRKFNTNGEKTPTGLAKQWVKEGRGTIKKKNALPSQKLIQEKEGAKWVC